MNTGTKGFVSRHIGPGPEDIKKMLETTGVASLDELIDKTIPASIRTEGITDMPPGISEQEYLIHMREIAGMNRIFKSYIGMGYYGTFMPPVIQRNILENPAWYTAYTPYQAEISQGRLEALLNFQTVITQLTGMEIANASLLDEGTAAAEAMIMFYNARGRELIRDGADNFFVDENIFPQTLEVIKTRAWALNINIITGDFQKADLENGQFFGALVQYPAGDGKIIDYREFASRLHEKKASLVVAADLMSLVLLNPPALWVRDAVVGSSQRFGLPMAYGGPHAAYFATTEAYKRSLPGRIIGISKDKENRPALRMALQTREQHIKREKATSNICTHRLCLPSLPACMQFITDTTD
jgi:glycine dehydrogenase